MPITGTFKADFSDFQAAVSKAEVSLKSFESGAGKVQTALNKMADSFSGRKVIQDAELATKAVSDIGGATKLTQAEQAKLNAQLTEALAKYKALGLEAPPAMVQLANETKKVDDAIEAIPPKATSLLGSLKNIAGAVGIGFSVGAVISFGKSVFDSAGQIGDLAKQLGLSTDAVQGFKYAAEQSGSSLDAVGKAVTKMNDNLATGSDSTINALKSVGLSFDNIRTMQPEAAFLAITDAIQKIPSPMQQTQVAVDLFGKSAAELLPAIKQGFRDVSDSASKMSEETIKNLKDAQDAWGTLATKVTIATGTIIAETIKATSHATRSWADFFEFMSPMGIRLRLPSTVAADAEEAAGAVDELGKAWGHMFGVSEQTAEEQKKAAEAAKKHAEALKELKDAITPLTDKQKELVLQLDAQGASADQIAKAYKMSATAITNFLVKAQDEAKDSLADYNEEIRRHKELQRQGEDESLAAIAKLEKEEFDAAQAALDDYNESVRRHNELQKQGEQLTLDALTKRAKESQTIINNFSKALSELAGVSGGTFGGIISDLTRTVAALHTAQVAFEGITSAQKSFGEFKKSLSQGLLEMSSGVLGLVSAGIAAGKAIASLFSLFDRNKGRDLVTAFAGEHGGFDALHQQLQQLGDEGEQLWVALTQGVGRNNPDQAKAAIEKVTSALNNIDKTGGGSGKTTSIEDAIAALGFHTQAELQATADKAKDVYDYMAQSGKYSADQVQKAWEASEAAQRAALGETDAARQKAVDAIKAMDDQIKSLSDSIAGEAPEEFMGVVEQQTRARIAEIQKQRDASQKALDESTGDAEQAAADGVDIIGDRLDENKRTWEDWANYAKSRIKDVGEAAASLSMPSSLPFSAGSGGGGGQITINNATYLDGDVITESVSRHLLS